MGTITLALGHAAGPGAPDARNIRQALRRKQGFLAPAQSSLTSSWLASANACTIGVGRIFQIKMTDFNGST